MFSTHYTGDFQIKLLATLYHCPKFFAEVKGWFHLTDWNMSGCRLLFEIMKKYADQYGTLPSWSVVDMEAVRALSTPGRYETIIQPPEYESLMVIMRTIAISSPAQAAIDAAYFRTELSGFLKHMRLALSDLEGALDANQRIANAVRIEEEIKRMGVGGDNFIMINAMDVISEQVATGIRVGTGVHIIDRNINMGLSPGMLGMLVACTGVGKTCGLINFAVSAAFMDVFSLFLTLELPGVRIQQRVQGVMACVPAAWFSQPRKMWPEDVLWRMQQAQAPDFRYGHNVKIGDMSDHAPTVADIERAVIKWKAHMVAMGVPESRCMIVFVDWLERMSPEGIKGITKNTNDSTIMQKMLEALGEVARRQNVIIWTATQATRDAMGREVLDIKHTAHSIHVHDPLDLSIGLAPQEVRDDDRDPALIPNDDTWQDAPDKPAPPCDRMLNASFMKARYSPVAGRYTSFYQGPTLKFWSRKEMCGVAERAALTRNIADMYAAMGALSYNL